MRETKQRKTILETLKAAKDHPSADIIYERVRQILPRISLGTVYRNLELLSTSGEISKISTASGQARFDGDTERHIHFRCTKCGKLEDFSYGGLETDLRSEISDGKKISGCYIEYFGECSQCNKK